jgi:predicted secreted protein
VSRYAAKGALLKQGATTIGQVFNIQGPGATTETLDVSDHDTTDAWREFVASFIDGGELTAEIHYDPALASHRLLYALQHARSVDAWSVTFPDATAEVASFNALVTNVEPGAPSDGKLTCSLSLKISGSVKGLGGDS